MDHAEALLVRKSQIAGLLEAICQALDLTPTQYKIAEDRYEAVGGWLSDSLTPALRGSRIRAHGSVRLQTANRPLKGDEFDVDLISPLNLTSTTPPSVAKWIVGERLRKDKLYSPLLEEKRRCWRLNYRGEFHLDVTPTIPNPACANGGELVPDKELNSWKPTNPRGYVALFERRALLEPRLLALEKALKYRADVEPLPAQNRRKGLLRRIVQLLKRDRDVYFSKNFEVAPISIVITTLAARAYEESVQHSFETELDLMRDVIARMAKFIRREERAAGAVYVIENETTLGENFADKWNEDPRLPVAFYTWHAEVELRLRRMIDDAGTDTLRKSLGEAYGTTVVDRIFNAYTQRISDSRTSGALRVCALGVTTAAAGVPARAHTFHGDP